MSLHRRRFSITTLFTLATLLPLVFVGVLLLAMAVRAVHESSASLGRDILEESSRQVDTNVRQYFGQTVRNSDLLSALVSDRILPSVDFRQWRERLFIRLRVTPEISSICFTNENLDTIYLMRYPPDLEFGLGVGHGDGSILRTYEAKADGTIAAEPKQAYEYDPRTRPWWIAGRNAGGPVWTDPYQWFSVPERRKESVLALAYTRCLRDREGNRLGVLSIDATLDQVDRYLASIVRTEGAFIVLTDAQKRLVGSSFGDVRSGLTPVTDLAGSPRQVERNVATLFRVSDAANSSTFKISLEEQDYWVRQVPLAIENGPTWLMTLAVPDSQLLRGAKSAVEWMKILGTLFLTAAVISAILLARSVTRPLRELAGFARQIGAGSFDQRVHPHSTREFDELAQALNTMAANLAERVQILAEKDAAEEASAIKAKLIAHVSHEFRTPLNAIVGYAEMVKDQARLDGQDRTERDVSNILLASRHLLTLINNLLDLSRVEAGKMRLDSVDFSIKTLLNEVSETVRPVLEGNDNRFDIVAPPQDARMMSDPARLKQILINLLGNAAKFTANGHITLSLELENGVACFTVTDTGPGMSPDQVGRLFEPFGQVQTTRHSPQIGAGLGLAISRQLAQLLGGTIEIESEEGKGTKAIVRIPRFHPFPDGKSIP
jgi:signal transduction histidine kinase